MVISNIFNKLNPYIQNKTTEQENRIKGTPKGEQGEKDKVNLSSEAQNLKKLLHTNQEEPELRTEKIAQLKEKIKNGEYVLDSRETAQKMLQEELDIFFKL